MARRPPRYSARSTDDNPVAAERPPSAAGSFRALTSYTKAPERIQQIIETNSDPCPEGCVLNRFAYDSGDYQIRVANPDFCVHDRFP